MLKIDTLGVNWGSCINNIFLCGFSLHWKNIVAFQPFLNTAYHLAQKLYQENVEFMDGTLIFRVSCNKLWKGDFTVL